MSKSPQLPGSAWFLVHCKARQEPRALENLTEQGYVCYLPTINAGKTLSVGTSLANKAERALFPGYLFVCLSPNSNWHSLRCTRGVLRVVGFNNKPYPIENDLIEQIKNRCKGHRALAPGEKVQVRVGLNAGIDAIFLTASGSERAVLLLKLLNQECRLIVSSTTIEPIPFSY
ncbi:transcription termination/antitermination NusG family protein [Stutzerimonas chloritidismutans]|uniref:transcription termination/antitermination NusG family protein n=1 Tax=Stutzerimonas chloritidismutans TaxID=203192 RepID=UPI00384CA9BB